MTRQSFYRLHALLQPYIQKKETHLHPTIHSTIRLAIFLYHISHGAAYTLLVNQFGVGKSSVSGIIGDVARAIVQQLGTKYSTRHVNVATPPFYTLKAVFATSTTPSNYFQII